MLEPRPDSPTAQRSPTPNPAEGRADLFAAFFFREAHHVFVEFLEQHQISIAYLELLHFIELPLTQPRGGPRGPVTAGRGPAQEQTRK